jgi:LPXTG-motif cell wall-anchored protein
VCPDGVESAWFVSARVQTWPEFIAFIVFIAGLLGFFLTRRKKS